ncbi:Double zinc ribbon [Poriferisphaera corsica]|uniref:Double zinc ribbon n=1 Tax=Poriferisphaera corsica TaxID=2528020 RepID=A0A517YVT8_9BACT|nr:zinc ribbon domain-containing protein [Poriferisphaera corsica]QDU34326.1 Double zinc ribbon [Poriferisphaera corsica]
MGSVIVFVFLVLQWTDVIDWPWYGIAAPLILDALGVLAILTSGKWGDAAIVACIASVALILSWMAGNAEYSMFWWGMPVLLFVVSSKLPNSGSGGAILRRMLLGKPAKKCCPSYIPTETSSNICGQCEHPAKQNDKFCYQCGADINEPKPPSESETQERILRDIVINQGKTLAQIKASLNIQEQPYREIFERYSEIQSTSDLKCIANHQCEILQQIKDAQNSQKQLEENVPNNTTTQPISEPITDTNTNNASDQPSERMQCWRCKYQAKEGDKFCHKCGAALNHPPKSHKKRSSFEVIISSKQEAALASNDDSTNPILIVGYILMAMFTIFGILICVSIFNDVQIPQYTQNKSQPVAFTEVAPDDQINATEINKTDSSAPSEIVAAKTPAKSIYIPSLIGPDSSFWVDYAQTYGMLTVDDGKELIFAAAEQIKATHNINNWSDERYTDTILQKLDALSEQENAHRTQKAIETYWISYHEQYPRISIAEGKKLWEESKNDAREMLKSYDVTTEDLGELARKLLGIRSRKISTLRKIDEQSDEHQKTMPD